MFKNSVLFNVLDAYCLNVHLGMWVYNQGKKFLKIYNSVFTLWTYTNGSNLALSTEKPGVCILKNSWLMETKGSLSVIIKGIMVHIY